MLIKIHSEKLKLSKKTNIDKFKCSIAILKTNKSETSWYLCCLILYRVRETSLNADADEESRSYITRSKGKRYLK
ncbi:hypothetical protein MSHOH_3738 [Methanosarcina horonobensis HB-1 = JCM 15518]|uniref:Uncharacterized protein n=1 Tax=Methanosarcina horonobensis HB-1 = JCM 15518 TaxID=1434110 RepID=A0A0E3SGH3_9EURY|nr:hypothetical protein MSHOH_3738 [Methanosarcina horonobensis HB-1 = JCM 15518]